MKLRGFTDCYTRWGRYLVVRLNFRRLHCETSTRDHAIAGRGLSVDVQRWYAKLEKLKCGGLLYVLVIAVERHSIKRQRLVKASHYVVLHMTLACTTNLGNML